MDHAARIRRLQDSLGETDVEALLVTDLANVRYLTGFSGTNGQVLVTADDALFLTDTRYEARAGDLVQDAEIAIYRDGLTDVLGPRVERFGRLGIEGDTVTLTQRDQLAEKLGPELVATSGLVEQLRRVKDKEEVDCHREAVSIADMAFAWVLDRIVPGATEREVALDLEVFMREHGADGVSFEPIVGSGPLSAHIHHSPSERAIERGDLVLLDFGCRKNGYCSDVTRTVVVGPATEEQKAIYDLVLRAQAAGVDAIAAGASGTDVDAAARSVISEAGHGDRFGHGLGHGIGLDIHEAPRLGRTSEDTLVAGNVVTVEPGVYLTGSGGVRIEDDVLVTEDGAEVLGSAPKDQLIEL